MGHDCWRDPSRLRAAMAAVPLCHPKLAVIAKVTDEHPAEQLARAMAARGKVIEGRATLMFDY